MPLRRLLASCLAAALVVPGLAVATPSLAPPLAQMPAQAQVMAPVVARFRADLASLERVHDTTAGPRREQALRRLYGDWQQRLAQIDPASLADEDRLDHALFRRDLAYRLEQLDFQRGRYTDAAPLLPGVSDLIALAEARRALEYPDGRTTATTLDRTRQRLADLQARLEKDPKALGTTPIVAYRAAGLLERVREDLKQWHGFHAGYDPEFTWWTRQPYEALDAQLESHAKLLRDKLAGASDPETIIGDPIGRDALLAGLQHELIPYTPEQLMALAERELAWCEAELAKAATEMGARDWREALERVKGLHPAPGDQPKLVVELADEAVHYLEANDLLTVPELAKRDWRMTMLSPEYQLTAPFFLGGQDVWVAYPTDTMPHEKKLMALRGNNRHFSRAVVHHELIPGHHLQYFYNNRYQTHRELFDTPFWTEGWALYWEFRLYERGFAQTPEDKIGMLFWRSHRAARILFSLGFHLGKLSPDEAVQLLVDRVGHERENARAEVRRSFAGDYGPLYQIAYMIGGLQFRALHEEFVVSGKMTEREFHDAILKGGPMPVAAVRARLSGNVPASDLRADWRFYD
ncbi:DUF885 family protein [Arenimonas donghaensis]|uniref:X-Pro dipeptidyl-peptidase n=1 Tax=Arenimonas donghaensis DSM 18148 = HO3-R19 TaxID=1121014 RepID=A0A087ML88_9GAMM|nr:DUF885 family protein [Arenimonas donghaensis]KFL37641.1 hypothetical protein N788_00295 [Arenimonas donghaensis DSM 18148 = HO3-R19]